MCDKLILLNAEGLALLDEGYAVIVKALNEKAEERAHFVSDMVKDQSGRDYPRSIKELFVSTRSDFISRSAQAEVSFWIRKLSLICCREAGPTEKSITAPGSRCSAILLTTRKIWSTTTAIRCRRACGHCAVS